MSTKINDVSPTFCILPWIHLASEPDGKAKLCCVAKDQIVDNSGRVMKFGHNSINEIWNSDYMKSVRSKMMAGTEVFGCSGCYNEEKNNFYSLRKRYNDEFFSRYKLLIDELMDTAAKGQHQLKSNPIFYDLRQGNICNLKCRSCNPSNSIQVDKEYRQLSINGNIKFWQLPDEVPNYDWFSSEKFQVDFLKDLPSIRRLYITGGEPTLIKANETLLKLAADNGYAKNISIVINTNVTQISDAFLENIKIFENVLINLSIDDVGRRQEYIRGNSNWEEISNNLSKLILNKTNNMSYSLSPVIQIYNILSFPDYLSWVDRLNLDAAEKIFSINPIILDSPRHLSIDILPPEVRKKARDYFQQLLSTNLYLRYGEFFRYALQDIIARLSHNNKYSELEMRDFFLFTKILDKKRNQDFASTFPELYAELKANCNGLI